MNSPTDKLKSGKIKSWQLAAMWLIAIVTMPILIDTWRHREAPEAVPRELLTDLDGAHIDLYQMSQAEPVLLYFWASWCSVCSAVSPTVTELRDSHPVVTVALSSGSREQVRAFAIEHDLGFRIVNDWDGDISRAWNVRATPTIAVLYKGRVHSMTTGITTPPGMAMRLWLAGMLVKPTASADVSPAANHAIFNN